MSSDSSNKKVRRSYPVLMYFIFTAFFGYMLFQFGWSEAEQHVHVSNPDDRSPLKATEEVLGYRARLNEKGDGVVGEATIKKHAEVAVWVMEQLGFIDSELAPSDPEKPAAPSSPKVAELKSYEKQLRSYKCRISKRDRIIKLWEENKKTRGQGYVRAIVDCEEHKFIYFPNLYGYIREDRLNYIIDVAKSLVDNPIFKDNFEQLRKDFEVAKRKNPHKPEREVWKDFFLDAYLRQPLTCPRMPNQECVKTWDGTTKADTTPKHDCYLVKPLADALTKAIAMNVEKGREPRDPIICWRSNLHQAILYSELASYAKKNMGASKPGIQLPGYSYHGAGLAMDLGEGDPNAYCFSFVAGMYGGFIPGDKGHWSLFEVALNGKNWGELKAIKLKKKWFDSQCRL